MADKKTIYEMRVALEKYCWENLDKMGCDSCLCVRDENRQCYTGKEETVVANYERVFGKKKEKESDEISNKEPAIKDSGNRTTFESGAVRDMQEDKGRCDLMPLDIVAELMPNETADRILYKIEKFKNTGDTDFLYDAVGEFIDMREWSVLEMLLEVSMHYKQGAEKYGAYNWQKGIPLHSYIDSGVRHFLKFTYGETDERHDRAFVWNMLGALWTMKHRPEMIDIPFELLGDKKNG